MIYEELSNYLAQVTSPETVAYFDSCVELFDNFNVEGYMDTLDMVFGDASQISDTNVVDQLKVATRQLLNELLQDHGVILIEDALDSERLELARGLYLIQITQQNQDILMILESEHSAGECFAELMQLVTPIHFTHTLSLIESIDNAFIDKAKTFFGELSEMTIVPVEHTHQQFLDYDKYKKMVGIELWTDQFFNHVDVVGMPYVVYLRSYINHHTDLLTFEEGVRDIGPNAKIQAIAKDAVAMACLSEETVAKAKVVIEEHVDDLFTEPQHATQFVMQVTQLLLEFNRG